MAGIAIKIDASQAAQASKQVHKYFSQIGSDAIKTESDVKKLEQRLKSELGTDEAKRNFDALVRSLHKTQIAMAKTRKEMGDYAGSLKDFRIGIKGLIGPIAIVVPENRTVC